MADRPRAWTLSLMNIRGQYRAKPRIKCTFSPLPQYFSPLCTSKVLFPSVHLHRAFLHCAPPEGFSPVCTSTGLQWLLMTSTVDTLLTFWSQAPSYTIQLWGHCWFHGHKMNFGYNLVLCSIVRWIELLIVWQSGSGWCQMCCILYSGYMLSCILYPICGSISLYSLGWVHT